MSEPIYARKRRPIRRFGSAVVFALLISAVAAIALIYGPDLLGDPEKRSIERTRLDHFERSFVGPLPGTPELASLNTRLATHGLTLGAPVLIRIFKRDFELELWMARDGRYHRFATYPICRWSGWLGPKLTTGDRQAPEGFYTVATNQMNPNSRWHRSFNLGFPNAFDQAHGRTGSALMVHGGCSSAGCFAMTNAVIDEIWQITTAALNGKQKAFQVQVFPFRMTEDNLAAHRDNPHIGFWRQLKAGSDLFESTLLPPLVTVCSGVYRFRAVQSSDTAQSIKSDCNGVHGSELTQQSGAKKAL